MGGVEENTHPTNCRYIVPNRHEAVETTFDEHRETTTFTFESELPKGPALLTIYYDGILNDKMAGFYRSTYKDAEGNTKVMGVTQFEATEARRAFPCWDEPSAKATFSIKLVVPVELEALSNMPIEQITQVEPEEKTVHFALTPVMSTYVSCCFDAPSELDRHGKQLRKWCLGSPTCMFR